MNRLTQNILLAVFVAMLGCHFGQSQSEDIDSVFEMAWSYHYVNKDSAYHYYEQVIDLAESAHDWEYVAGGLSYLINVNDHFYDLAAYQDNIARFETLLDDKQVEKDGFSLAEYYKDRILLDKGIYHYKLREYATAQRFFLQLNEKLNAVPEEERTALDIETISSIYSFLGLIYRHTGKYEQAEFIYKKDISLNTMFKDSIEDWESAVFNSKKLLSQVYEIQNKTESANELLQEALAYYSSNVDLPRFRNNFLTTYILLAKNHIKQNDFEGALAILDHNQPNSDDFKGNPFLKEIEIIYGDAFLGMNNYTKAQKHYENALEKYRQYREGAPHQDIAFVHGKIAELFLKQKRYSEGLESVQKAFNSAGRSVRIESFRDNPDPNNVFSKTQLLSLLDIKLQLLIGKFESEGEEELLAMAVRTDRDLLATFDLLKKEFDSKLDKQYLVDKAYPIFGRMLEVAYTAYERSKAPEIFELALNIAEKNKDFVLLEALRSAQATQYGDVPREILDKEAQLRAAITHQEKEIFDATESSSGFSLELYELKQAYYSLLDSIKINYPKYHDLKYRIGSLNVDLVRDKILIKNGTLISYSIIGDALYVIILNRSEEKFLKLSFSDREREAVRNFYRLLSQPSIENNEKEIANLGESIFRKILKKPLEGLKTEKLTIIPDGELHYLPFDLLLEDGAYLLKTKQISYGNSVNSLMELQANASVRKNRVLAFAPSFKDFVEDNTGRQFGKLHYNDLEVSKIGEFYDTETVLDEKATLESFRTKTSDFNILHLATHASANDQNPDYSYLVFSRAGDVPEGDLLYVKDLYDTKLDADMVTLSACRTGIGKLKKGQGMLSLSKGFYYAGAKSLVNTLWKINDKSTVRLMEYFYAGLGEGKSKSEALRDAKLRYLENTDDNLLRHPYYWAAFVVSGDVSPVTETRYRWYILAGILFFLILYFVSKSKVGVKGTHRILLRTKS